MTLSVPDSRIKLGSLLWEFWRHSYELVVWIPSELGMSWWWPGAWWWFASHLSGADGKHRHCQSLPFLVSFIFAFEICYSFAKAGMDGWHISLHVAERSFQESGCTFRNRNMFLTHNLYVCVCGVKKLTTFTIFGVICSLQTSHIYSVYRQVGTHTLLTLSF